VEAAILAVLIVVMTRFVITETTKFFEDSGFGGETSRTLGAIWEVLSLVFTYFTARTRILNFGRKVLVIALCLFNICIVSGKQFSNSSNQHFLAITAQTTIAETEREIKLKENLRSQYLEKSWLSAARKFDQSIDVLHQKLQTQRDLLKQAGDPTIIVSNMWIQVVSRILLMLANLWCVKRVAEIIKTPKNSPTLQVQTKQRVKAAVHLVSENASNILKSDQVKSQKNHQSPDKFANVLNLFTNGNKTRALFQAFSGPE
jgi:hypothetical protein